MRAEGTKLIYFLEGHDKKFVIPIYQRNYDWQVKHCQQLFDDLLGSVASGKSHFIGSIVRLYNKKSKGREYSIIDGQQRLTTVSILLLSIHNLLKKKRDDYGVNLDELYNTYLINEHEPKERRLKLKPMKDDRTAFEALFSAKETHFVQNSNLTRNYKFFYSRLDADEDNISKVYDALKNLTCVDIDLIVVSTIHAIELMREVVWFA